MRIIVADDHPVILMGIKALFASFGNTYEFVGEAHNGRDLLALLAAQPCDLLITDFSMPDEQGSSDGLPLLKRLRRDYPELPIIILTMVHNPSLISGMLAAGARGVVDKASMTRELLQAIQTVLSGRTHLSEQMRAEIADLRASHGDADTHVALADGGGLSKREAEVVRLYASGHSVTQIAEQLHRSVKTVSQQKNDAMRKLGLKSNSQLYEYARNYGLVS
ncbi:response regulator transcription factor [Dyella tabacisoli]|uniref:DNA-binding response regulator n=1 Tax=Dyella tabacisoli TaxID=2282381 RepID=A0A369UTE6_9GAMM|nr:response regulator transcription factor [Dyella tabacisoli]RDD83325.1 DNA-binding response regulator [Dyella tabacisoli]